MSASTIVIGLKQLLGQYLPFSTMAQTELDFVVDHVSVAYYAPGELIVGPDDGVPAHCVIVKHGMVQGASTETGSIVLHAAVGDCFPVGALLASRPVTLTYRAIGDTFCLLLPRAKFDELVRRSAAFHDFCKRKLGALLDQSRLQLQQSYATEAGIERTMSTALGDLARKPPLTCTRDTSLREAFKLMQDAHVGSIVIVDIAPDGERILGILTRSDLISRVILPELSLGTAVGEVMSSGALTLDSEATAADATLMMAEHSIRHIPVVQRVQGRQQVIGVVSERDLFTLQRLGVRQLSAEIRRSADVDALITVAASIRKLSHYLVAQGVAASHVTTLISRLNDQLTMRLLALMATEFKIPADNFCWLAFGSEGRQEQTISTDQDNGIAYVAGSVAPDRLLEFAQDANRSLAACGFPLCKGNIMAGNPQWCLTYARWETLFAGWIDRGDPTALLNASIFFDFRPLFGNVELASRLRTDVLRRARNERFLKQMSDNALRNRPPSTGGLLGPSHVDLKMNGTVPFVDAARIWAYAAGLEQTNTSERLTRLAELGRLPATDVRGWIAAFEFFQLMRLREQQHRSVGNDLADHNPNCVEVSRLSPLDRRIINEAFRQARKLQQRLELDFPG